MADYNSIHSGAQIDEAVGRALPGGAIDTALAGKAPAGYGLGEINNHISDLNDTTLMTGFYTLPGTGAENVPPLIPSSQTAVVLIQRRGNTIYQTVCHSGRFAIRIHSASSGWGEWAYENPYMQLGVEYRTTEWYLGKPVYTKLVDFGALPNTTTKSVVWGSANTFRPFFYSGSCSNSNALPYITGTDTTDIDIAVDGGKVYITTASDRSGVTANVLIKYYKTTD